MEKHKIQVRNYKASWKMARAFKNQEEENKNILKGD